MSKVFKMPKITSNCAAEFMGTNSKVGKTYPSVCKEGLCYPGYLIDQVMQCVKCNKIKA